MATWGNHAGVTCGMKTTFTILSSRWQFDAATCSDLRRLYRFYRKRYPRNAARACVQSTARQLRHIDMNEWAKR